jgi:hypothetical protein
MYKLCNGANMNNADHDSSLVSAQERLINSIRRNDAADIVTYCADDASQRMNADEPES